MTCTAVFQVLGLNPVIVSVSALGKRSFIQVAHCLHIYLFIFNPEILRLT